jgi:acetyl-CoA C-acetyltransferase
VNREVVILGVGSTKGGEHWEKSLRQLFVEAALAAIDDAGVDKIDSMYVGCMSGGLFNGQEHIASLMADYLGQKHIPATRVESACASGGAALRMGYMEVMSGMNDIVLVGGVEKMTDVSTDGATYALSTAADQDFESFYGVTFPGLYAMIARAHMHRYGTTPEQLAAVAVKNHLHASMNPLAQYPHKITVDQVLNSVMVADPLHILDCSPITDGASAAIICTRETAEKITSGNPSFRQKPLVKISGSGHATDSIALHSRNDLTGFRAVTEAANRAYKMAGKNPGDIDVAEVHDCFTIAEICVLEAIGLVEKGQGGEAAESGFTALDGRIAVNTSGGLKAKGHPVGATGVAQAVEIVFQLRGEAGDRQVKNAKVGLTQNMGGTGGSCVVHIMEAI